MILLLTKNRFYLITLSKECLSVFRSPLNARLLKDRLTIGTESRHKCLPNPENPGEIRTHDTIHRDNDVTVGDPSLSNKIRFF